MKQGNQFFCDIKIYDEKYHELTNEGVEKIVFYIGDIKKTYEDGSEEVIYDENNKCFKVWLAEEETLELNGEVEMDARILFITGEILGCYIKKEYFNPVLVKESILDEGE